MCICFDMALYEEIMNWLEVELRPHGEKARLSRLMETAPNTVTRWFSPKEKDRREPSGRMLCTALESLGVKVIFPGDEIPVQEDLSPEARHLDGIIKGMRKSHAGDKAIKAAMLEEIDELFEKNEGREDKAERRLAG